MLIVAFVVLPLIGFVVGALLAPEFEWKVRKLRKRFRDRRALKHAVPLSEALPGLLARAGEGVFHPHVFYNEPGDMFEVYWGNPEQGYTKWINHYLELQLEHGTKRIVGCTITQVHSLIRDGNSCPDHSPERCEPSEVS